MMKVLALLLVGLSLTGCEIIAAGIIGADIEQHHQQWCRDNPGKC